MLTNLQNKVERFYASHHRVTDILCTDDWDGKRCFIVGGGESLKDFDFHKLDNELTIGTNRSFEFYNSSLLYFMDTKLYQWAAIDKIFDYNKWRQFAGHKISTCPCSDINFNFESNIYFIRRLFRPVVSRNLNEGMYPSSNAGLGAVMLAVILGASPIYLLGFDMHCLEFTHWHNGYPNQEINEQNKIAKSYITDFNRFFPIIRDLNFEVINLVTYTGATSLNCFPIQLIDEII